ncbi:hypothetical protein GW17_00037822 [Ensete ventricosum]|nr:hypothetical protein GW17_00037822 [Ensete ventricosum]
MTRLWPRPARKGGRRHSQVQQPARETGIARRGSSPQGWQPFLGTPACSTAQRGRLQGARKGLPLAASPTASRGGGAGHRGGCPLAGWLSAGKGIYRLRRGSSGGPDGARGVRSSF